MFQSPSSSYHQCNNPYRCSYQLFCIVSIALKLLPLVQRNFVNGKEKGFTCFNRPQALTISATIVEPQPKFRGIYVSIALKLLPLVQRKKNMKNLAKQFVKFQSPSSSYHQCNVSIRAPMHIFKIGFNRPQALTISATSHKAPCPYLEWKFQSPSSSYHQCN